jgi:hypothetical protein
VKQVNPVLMQVCPSRQKIRRPAGSSSEQGLRYVPWQHRPSSQLVVEPNLTSQLLPQLPQLASSMSS